MGLLVTAGSQRSGSAPHWTSPWAGYVVVLMLARALAGRATVDLGELYVGCPLALLAAWSLGRSRPVALGSWLLLLGLAVAVGGWGR